ncbi:MAG TPA: hemolysin D [Cyanobacteria bacterium UBA11372]|nr:hemolysin D [Cyanobacteria bacterium UBA11372]
MTNTLNGRLKKQLDEIESAPINSTPPTLDSTPPTPVISNDDWSDATKDLLDSLPRVWTRGMLYFVVTFVSIVLPWAMLSKVDETGSARGRLEPFGATQRLDAPVAGTVTAVRVKEGETVKAGQLLLELDSDVLRTDFQQAQNKLEGQQNRLGQLQLLKNQIMLAISVQEQQNQAQQSEKIAQVNQAQQDLNSKQTAYNFQTEEQRAAVEQAQQNLDALKKAYNSQTQEKLAAFEQAQQNLDALKKAYNSQTEEKLAGVGQVQQTLSQSKNAFEFAKIRVKSDQIKFERYKQALEEGIISKDRFNEVEQALQASKQALSSAQSDISQAELRLKEQQNHYQNFIHQTQSDISQAQLRLKEQQSRYQNFIHQTQSDISQAQLRLKEQQSRYQNFIHQAKSDISQAQLRLKEQQSAYQSLIQAGKLAVLKTQEQLKDLQTQITTLQAEIAQIKTQIQSLKLQLEQRVLRAPVSGIIFQLPIQKAGAVVQPSQMVAEIAPQETPLVLKAQMATGESGLLREGMPVKMKFDAYPFQDYGILEGRLSKIAPSSKVTETSQGQIATYDLEISLNQTCIPSANQCIALTPGQTATAEVIVRQRRIIDFLLDPFKQLQKGGFKL